MSAGELQECVNRRHPNDYVYPRAWISDAAPRRRRVSPVTRPSLALFLLCPLPHRLGDVPLERLPQSLVEREAAFKVLPRFLIVALRQVRQAALRPGDRQLGAEFDRPAEVGLGPRQVAPSLPECAAVEPGVGQAGRGAIASW